MPTPQAGQQLIVALNKMASATEHLARAVDATNTTIRALDKAGHNPAGVLREAASVLGTIFQGGGGKKR